MSSPPKVFPEFFKVYLPEFSWDRMQIPTAFVKHFNGFVPEKAILRDSVGRVWHVEVGQIGKNVYFLKGWRQFLADNLVEEGDLFVFQYDGSYIFDFKLFGTTGCQKKDSREVNVDVNKKKFFVKGEEDVEEVERNEEQEEEEEEEEPQSKSSNKGVVVFKRKYSGRGPLSIGGYKQTAIKKTRSAYKETSHTKSKYKKACTGNVEVDNALDFKSIVKPENPCFITKIRPGRSKLDIRMCNNLLEENQMRKKVLLSSGEKGRNNEFFVDPILQVRSQGLEGRVSGVDDALLAEAAAFTSRPDSLLGEEISAEGGAL